MTNATTNGQSVIYANGKIDAKATNGVGYPPPPIISPVTSFADYQECLALTHQLYRAWDEGVTLFYRTYNNHSSDGLLAEFFVD